MRERPNLRPHNPEGAEPPKPGFEEWLTKVNPTWHWEWNHLAYARDYLDLVDQGRIRRLMFFMPPRHGKTEQNTVRYSVYRVAMNPHTRVIIGAYNQSTASAFGRKTKRLAELLVTLSREQRGSQNWETVEGGGVRAVGVGAGVTGLGANLILIDDPVKSREEAQSLAYRDRVWNWYKDDLWTRQEPGAAIVLTMTRWHEDDLAGRIIAEMEQGGEKWVVVSLPALAGENDSLGREPGEALCPERFNEQDIENAKRVLKDSYHALYQQTPRPPEGDMFKRDWFKVIPFVHPEIIKHSQKVRYWDKAGTDGAGDYTVGVLMLRYKHMYIIADVVRGQWSLYKREQHIRETARLDREKYGQVHIWIEQEPNAGGKDSAQISVNNLAGFRVSVDRKLREIGDKVVRAGPLASQAESGNVWMVKGVWNLGYINEMCDFPTASKDDQVDASGGAFNKLTLGRRLEIS